MGEQPTGAVALNNRPSAIAHVSASQYEKRCARIQVEFDATLESAKIQPGPMTSARRQRIVEIVADPQLVTGSPSHRPNVARDSLVELKSLLDSAVFFTPKSAAKCHHVQDVGFQLKKIRIKVLQLSTGTGCRGQDPGQNKKLKSDYPTSCPK